MSVTVPIEPPPGLYTVPPRMTLPSPAAPAADPGGFSVDLERAPQVIRDLTNARNELFDLINEARRLSVVDPGTQDDVSRDAAMLIGLTADGGEASLSQALDGAVRYLDGLISAVEAELIAYRAVDDENRARFGVTRS